MTSRINDIGLDFIKQEIASLTEQIVRIKPSEFSERYRYLPSAVSSIPGPYSYAVNPYMVEIVDCFELDSGITEVNLLKGVQITATTGIIEAILLYYMVHIKTLPIMYMTADRDLAVARVENNILPMLHQSGFSDIIKSSDIDNKRKTGKTKSHLQWGADGYLVPFGAKNADRMRSYSIAILLKDELDSWPEMVGKDGDPDMLSDARTNAYSEQRKILRIGTPAEYPSKMEKQYNRGDKRKYMVKCLKCGFEQSLRWTGTNDDGKQYGVKWELNDGVLDFGSVRYHCQSCLHAHEEHDKIKMFSAEHGARWVATAKPINPNVRSYHLPGMYSPHGMTTWADQVMQYLNAYDPENNKPRDLSEFQVFYNNVLGKPFKVFGSRVAYDAVKTHRRPDYHFGEIPNDLARKQTGGPILFLTCQVDVHKHNLAVAVMGWTEGARCYLIDYWRFEDKGDPGCEDPSSKAWSRLSALIEDRVYHANDGTQYRIIITLVDSAYIPDTVSAFCGNYESGVFPILGRTRSGNVKYKEYREFRLSSGIRGFQIVVDHYKDRIAQVLRREWDQTQGIQDKWHFNTPLDITEKQMRELTAESREKHISPRGVVSHTWHRPSSARNELWDLLVYGHAAVELMAWDLCLMQSELETIDWDFFWEQF